LQSASDPLQGYADPSRIAGPGKGSRVIDRYLGIISKDRHGASKNPMNGQGEPLPDKMRLGLEHVLKVSLGDMRMIRDSAVAQAVNQTVHVVGNIIHIAPGAFDPNSRELLQIVMYKVALERFEQAKQVLDNAKLAMGPAGPGQQHRPVPKPARHLPERGGLPSPHKRLPKPSDKFVSLRSKYYEARAVGTNPQLRLAAEDFNVVDLKILSEESGVPFAFIRHVESGTVVLVGDPSTQQMNDLRSQSAYGWTPPALVKGPSQVKPTPMPRLVDKPSPAERAHKMGGAFTQVAALTGLANAHR
ncbi:MAG: hypothetical protein AAGC55_12130, partial [Myxococcota bacterium]